MIMKRQLLGTRQNNILSNIYEISTNLCILDTLYMSQSTETFTKIIIIVSACTLDSTNFTLGLERIIFSYLSEMTRDLSPNN